MSAACARVGTSSGRAYSRSMRSRARRRWARFDSSSGVTGSAYAGPNGFPLPLLCPIAQPAGPNGRSRCSQRKRQTRRKAGTQSHGTLEVSRATERGDPMRALHALRVSLPGNVCRHRLATPPFHSRSSPSLAVVGPAAAAYATESVVAGAPRGLGLVRPQPARPRPRLRRAALPRCSSGRVAARHEPRHSCGHHQRRPPRRHRRHRSSRSLRWQRLLDEARDSVGHPDPRPARPAGSTSPVPSA